MRMALIITRPQSSGSDNALIAKGYNLKSIISSLTFTAGEDLSNFWLLSRWEIGRFEREVKNFWRAYGKNLQDTAEGNLSSISVDSIHYVRHFHRLLVYRKEGKDCAQLPAPFCLNLAHSHSYNQRVRAAGRVLWLEQRKANKLDLYPQTGRYTPLNNDQEFLMNHLPKKVRWLVDRRVPLTLETHILIAHIENFMIKREKWSERLSEFVPFVVKQRLGRIPHVSTFTTAMEANFDHETCEICCCIFGPNSVERAVQTKCNHTVGAVCLQKWVDMGQYSCPYCRQTLYNLEDVLPDAAIRSYRKLLAVVENAKALDPQIDELLMKGGSCVKYGGQFVEIVEAMDGFDGRCQRRLEHMCNAFENFKG